MGEPAGALMARVRQRYGTAPLTNASLLDRCADRWPAAPAVVSERQRWSFSDLQSHAAQVATGLHACLGVEARSRVALFMGNRAEYIGAFFGVARTATVVPLNTRLRAPEVAYILDDAGVATVVTEERLLPVLADVATQRDLHVVALRGMKSRPLPFTTRRGPPVRPRAPS